MIDLYLMRHAKSGWDDAFLDDFDRPLNKRGRQAVPLVGQWMIEQNICPELVLCSTAKRCTSTLKLLKQEGIKFPDVSFHEVLYHASSGELISLIRTLPDKLKSLMIIGHNPGMHVLANSLMKVEEATASPACEASTKREASPKSEVNSKSEVSAPFEEKYPTAAVVHLQFDVKDWTGIAEGGGTLYRYITPKLLLKAQN